MDLTLNIALSLEGTEIFSDHPKNQIISGNFLFGQFYPFSIFISFWFLDLYAHFLFGPLYSFLFGLFITWSNLDFSQKIYF